jgi:predicted transcriptional regulator
MAAALAFPQLEESPVAEKLRARMTALNVGQSFVAEYSGFSQSEMSKILAGIRTPDSARVKQIEATLSDLEGLAKMMRPAKIVWDLPSVTILVKELLKKPEAKKEFEKSLEKLRGGLDALKGN